MKKRILYGLFFTSLMIISTISVIAQPAAGASWTFGVPDAAKGMTLESEVKVYEKETWGTSVGQIVAPDDNVNNWFGGDRANANDVGATSRSKILDWRNDDIWFFGDHLMHSEIGTNPLGLVTYWDGVSFTDDTLNQLSALTGGMALSIGGFGASPGIIKYMGDAHADVAWGTPSIAECEALYAKTYPGVIVERNAWYFDLEHDDSPDAVAQNLPFIEDPHNILDSYNYFVGFAGELFGRLDDIVTATAMLDITLNTFPNRAAWDAALPGIIGMTSAQAITTIQTQCLTIKGFFQGKIPDKKNYLNLMLRGGLPAHQPVDKWWETVLEDFNIEENNLWDVKDAPYIHKGGVEQDGMVITVTYEWEAGATWQDADGTVDVLDDYEVIYTYSDTGGQSSVEFTDGDDVFYKIESLAPVIPGYEISILLAAAAISAIALIYVVMKKKRM